LPSSAPRRRSTNGNDGVDHESPDRTFTDEITEEERIDRALLARIAMHASSASRFSVDSVRSRSARGLFLTDELMGAHRGAAHHAGH